MNEILSFTFEEPRNNRHATPSTVVPLLDRTSFGGRRARGLLGRGGARMRRVLVGCSVFVAFIHMHILLRSLIMCPQVSNTFRLCAYSDKYFVWVLLVGQIAQHCGCTYMLRFLQNYGLFYKISKTSVFHLNSMSGMSLLLEYSSTVLHSHTIHPHKAGYFKVSFVLGVCVVAAAMKRLRNHALLSSPLAT